MWAFLFGFLVVVLFLFSFLCVLGVFQGGVETNFQKIYKAINRNSKWEKHLCLQHIIYSTFVNRFDLVKNVSYITCFLGGHGTYINFVHQKFHDRCMRPLRLTLLDFSQIDIFAIMVMTVIHILTTAHSFQLYTGESR